MSELILFHHAQGLTQGVEAFADELRAAGHRVTVPDLYEGATFSILADGVAHAEQIGMYEIIDRGVKAAANLPASIVYAGFSLGVLPAQKLAQTRPGALGALLYHEGVAASTFGTAWPDRVALQVHLGVLLTNVSPAPNEHEQAAASDGQVADECRSAAGRRRGPGGNGRD